jgi:predicted ABC-type ATPase
MAIYTISAGVNGAGKTSIYRSIYYERHHFTSNLKIPKNTTYQIPLKYQY